MTIVSLSESRIASGKKNKSSGGKQAKNRKKALSQRTTDYCVSLSMLLYLGVYMYVTRIGVQKHKRVAGELAALDISSEYFGDKLKILPSNVHLAYMSSIPIESLFANVV